MDLIERQAAIDAVCEHGTELERRGITVLAVANHKQVTVDLLESLPSAQPDGRYINADELIKRLKGAGHEEAASMALKMAGHERKKNLPSAQPEQRWIPCNERLPEESGNYLVTAMWKGRPEVDMDYWQFDCMWDDWGDEVIAWMPLPEPYKEGERMTDLIREVGDKP